MTGTVTRSLYQALPFEVRQPIVCGLCGLGIAVRDVRHPLTCLRVHVAGQESPLCVLNRQVTLCEDCVRTIAGGKSTEQAVE